jgi:hypothetical protein
MLSFGYFSLFSMISLTFLVFSTEVKIIIDSKLSMSFFSSYEAIVGTNGTRVEPRKYEANNNTDDWILFELKNKILSDFVIPLLMKAKVTQFRQFQCQANSLQIVFNLF